MDATQAGELIVKNFTAAERRACSSFFSGRESTRFERDALRSALAAATDVVLVSGMRAMFNQAREQGEPIPACHVTSAIRLLRKRI